MITIKNETNLYIARGMEALLVAVRYSTVQELKDNLMHGDYRVITSREASNHTNARIMAERSAELLPLSQEVFDVDGGYFIQL